MSNQGDGEVDVSTRLSAVKETAESRCDNDSPAQAVSEPDRYAAVRNAYPPILNTAQVAELLDLNPRTVLNMAGDGRLPASRLPGSRKFHFILEDLINTLEGNRVRD